jgi:thiol-disulfide isomerase/thioredoxin
MLLAALLNGPLTDLIKIKFHILARACAAIVFISVAAFGALAQSSAPPKITQIDILGLRRIVRPQGKPLLINFWATWCVPCREEYPDLVKIDQEYRGKIDFVTVSLDEVADKDTLVPQFLSEMKAQMPPYLLVTDNEEAAMAVVSKDWTGGLPFTILFDAKGGIAYSRQGKVKIDILKAALVRSVPSAAPVSTANR